MTTANTTMHRENLGTEAGEYIVHFSKVQSELSNGGKRVTLVVEKDTHESQPETVTLWLDKGEDAPARKTVIMAMVERTKVTNLANGREYLNADVRTWDFA